MKKIISLIALLFAGMVLFAQDPQAFNEESEEIFCEPFLAAQYERSSQTLTIRYESCDEDVIFWGWCGTYTCGFGEIDQPGKKKNSTRDLVVGSLTGNVHYQTAFSLYENIPELLTINNIVLNDGIYFVRLQTVSGDEKKVFFVKFAVN